MKIAAKFLGLTAAIGLAACGENSVETNDAPVTKAPVAAAKFKGAKFAPPQADMNRTAAAELWDREGSRKITPGEACKRVRRMSQMTPECQADYDNLLERSVFLPTECRKGDERDGYSNVLIDPVTCDGEIQTPAGGGNVTMIFHKVDSKWKAWYGNMVSGSWKAN